MQSVIGVYPNMAEARAAVQELIDIGFPAELVSLIGQDLARGHEPQGAQGIVDAGQAARADAQEGAGAGGLFGLLVGVAFLPVPGFGPLIVAGPLVAAILGGIEGAALGALDVLMKWGVEAHEIPRYESLIRGGKYLLVAHGSHDDMNRARELLANTHADMLKLHPRSNTQMAASIR